MTTTEPVAAWTSPHDWQWTRFAAQLRPWVGCVTSRHVRVVINPHPRAAVPAGVFNHVNQVITIDATQAMPGCPDPARIDLTLAADRARHAVLTGVLGHEAGHAEHTFQRKNFAPALAEWAALLEEPRMEGRVVSRVTEARQWFRAAVTHILGTGDPTDTITAARVLILIGGRILAGVLDARDLPDMDTLLAQRLTPHQIAEITLATALAVDAADGDLTTLAFAAERVRRVLPDPDRDDDNDNGDAGEDSCGHGRGDHLDPGGVLGRALAAIGARAARELKAAAGISDPSPAEKVREQVREAREAVVASEVADASLGFHQMTARKPTPQEYAQCSALIERVRHAQIQEPVISTVRSTAPPGRLRVSELVRQGAQRQAGAAVTGTPWVSTRRRTDPNPDLYIGIALDTSLSMRDYASPAAAAGWMLARTVKVLGGQAETATWNSSVSLSSVKAHTDLINVPEIVGGSDALPTALRVLDRTLMFDRARGARVVAIVTDGELDDAREVRAEVSLLIAKGVRVLWLSTIDPQDSDYAMDPPDGTTAAILDNPEQVGVLIGDAAVAALKA